MNRVLAFLLNHGNRGISQWNHYYLHCNKAFKALQPNIGSFNSLCSIVNPCWHAFGQGKLSARVGDLLPPSAYIYSCFHNGELIKTLSRIFSSWWIKGGRWLSLIKMKDHWRPWPCIGRWLICTRRSTSDLWSDVKPPLTSSDRVPSGRFYYLDFRSFFNIKIPFSPHCRRQTAMRE